MVPPVSISTALFFLQGYASGNVCGFLALLRTSKVASQHIQYILLGALTHSYQILEGTSLVSSTHLLLELQLKGHVIIFCYMSTGNWCQFWYLSFRNFNIFPEHNGVCNLKVLLS